jgi:hypothetical protein
MSGCSSSARTLPARIDSAWRLPALGTHEGLLLNELRHAPESTLRPLSKMLASLGDLDRVGGGCAAARVRGARAGNLRGAQARGRDRGQHRRGGRGAAGADQGARVPIRGPQAARVRAQRGQEDRGCKYLIPLDQHMRDSGQFKDISFALAGKRSSTTKPLRPARSPRTSSRLLAAAPGDVDLEFRVRTAGGGALGRTDSGELESQAQPAALVARRALSVQVLLNALIARHLERSRAPGVLTCFSREVAINDYLPIYHEMFTAAIDHSRGTTLRVPFLPKHHAVRLLKLRELIDDGLIDLQPINTTDNIADIFTEANPAPVLRAHLATMHAGTVWGLPDARGVYPPPGRRSRQ